MSSFQESSHTPLPGAAATAKPRHAWRRVACTLAPATITIVLLLASNAAALWMSGAMELVLVGQARLNRSYHEASLHLAQHIRTGSVPALDNYRASMAPLMGTRQARAALLAPQRDDAAVIAGMALVGRSPAQARTLMLMMDIMGQWTHVQAAVAHWTSTDQIVRQLEAVQTEVESAKGALAPAAQEAWLARIAGLTGDIDRQTTAFGQAFMEASSELRRSQQTLNVGLGVLLLLFSVGVAARALNRMARIQFELELANERFELAATAANVGIWDWNLRTRNVAWTPHLRELLGFLADEGFAGVYELRGNVHPDDATEMFQRLRLHIEGHSPRLDLQLRLRCADGAFRWFRLRGMATHDAHGSPERLLGTLTDVHETVVARQTQLQAAEERRQAAAELELALDSASVALWGYDVTTGTIQHVRRWEVLLGHRRMPSTVDNWNQLIHPADREQRAHRLAQHLRGETPSFECEYRMKHASGSWVWVRCHGRVTRRGADGAALEYAGAVMNVSREVAARQAQRLQYEFLQAMIEGIDTGIMLSSMHRIEYVNEGLCRMLGYHKDQLVGKAVASMLTTKEAGNLALAWRRQAAAGAEAPMSIIEVRNAQGQPVKLVCTLAHVRWNGVSHFLTTITPMSDFDAVEAKLQSAQARFERVLVSQLETQQAHIARELHDSLGSVLAGLSLLLGAVRSQAETGRPVTDLLERCQDQVREAAETTRALARGIMPVGTHDGALLQALERFVQDAETVMGITVELDVDCALDDVGPVAGNHIYRVVQEAVSNAVRHGLARRVCVRVTQTERFRTYSIDDDGTGLPATGEAGSGMGLRSMHARAEAVGGKLELGRSPLGGAQVTLRIPLALAHPFEGVRDSGMAPL